MARQLIEEAVHHGATKTRACEVVGVSVRSLQRWSHQTDDGEYLASESTFHRILKKAQQLHRRGREANAVKRSKPAEHKEPQGRAKYCLGISPTCARRLKAHFLPVFVHGFV
jgi:hypothetical protein